MRKSIYRKAALCAWLLLVMSCSCLRRAQSLNSQVDVIWNEHMVQLETALQAQRFDTTEFSDAVAFFERTTGIGSESLTYLGVLPLRIDDAIRDWQRWYRENRSFLWFDEEAKTIRLRNTETILAGTQPSVRRVAHEGREIEIDARIEHEGPLLDDFVRRGLAVSAIWKVPGESSLMLAIVERPAAGASYGPQLVALAIDGGVRVVHESGRLYDDDFVNPTFFTFADRTLVLADHGSEDAYGVLAWSIEKGGIRDLGELPIALPEGDGVFTEGAAPEARVTRKDGKYVITIPGPVLLNPRGEDERVLAQKGETVVFHEVAGTFKLARP